MASKEYVVCAILLGFVYSCTLYTAGYGAQEKPIYVVLKGRVVCDACNSDELSFSDVSDIISGAVVAVECNRGLNRKTSTGVGLVSIEGETDENGEFKVELPGSNILFYDESILKGYCSARLLSSPPEKCNVPFPVTSSSDQPTLTSGCHGIRTFTFPSLSYRSQSRLCSDSNIIGSSDHESLRSGRVLHEVSKIYSSSDMDASFPHANLPPLPKPELGFPPLHLPLSRPVLGFPPLHLPHPRPVLSFPPLHLPHPQLGFPPLHLPHPQLGFPPQPAVSSFPPLHLSHPQLGFPPQPAGIPLPAPRLLR